MNEHFTGERSAVRRRQQPGRPHELAAAIGDPGARGGGIEPRDGDPDKVVVTVGLGVERRRASLDDGRGRQKSEPISQRRRHACDGAHERSAISHTSHPLCGLASVVNVRGLDGYLVNATFSPRRKNHLPLYRRST